MVSSELETAHAVSGTIGLPAAKQTDVFADGQVQIVEFDVPRDAGAEDLTAIPLTKAAERAASRPLSGAYEEVVGRPLREATIPPDSKVASIIRGDRVLVPRGDESIKPGDRIIVIGSPDSARQWGQIMARGEGRVDDVVIYGGGATGLAIARVLLDQRIRVRLIEPRDERAREVAEELPDARVYCATGVDPDFIERERIGQARAAVFAMREDSKNLYAATLAQGPRRRLHDRHRPRADLGRGVRARGHRRRGQPALGHGRGDRPVCPRPAHPPAGDARG